MASRAEARRAAILARGSDRLAKLTTSARGEDHPAYQVHEKLHKGPSAASDDPPLPTIMPTGQNDAFSQAQQQQFIQALMNGDAPAMPANGMAGESPFLTPNPGEDPLAAMMARFAPIEAGAQTGSTAVRKPAPWWLPLIHILSTLSLVAYFTLFTPGGIWTANQTWMDKIRQYSGSSTVGVPFFALFMALQVALHSLRIIFGFDAVQTPTLLAFALPHLPSALRITIVQGLKYLSMAGAFADDISIVLVFLGFSSLVLKV